jgi:hypothetical protein
MTRDDMTMYDIRPKYMDLYLSYNGPHFNENLLNLATSLMVIRDNGKKVKLTPYSIEEVDELLKKYNINLINKHTMYDYVYVANMCKADFLNDSIPDEEHLAKYIKNVIDDVDGYDGIVFNRWYADMCKKGIPINWKEMI